MSTSEVIEKILNGVSIVTSKKGDEVNGAAIAWISQVSFEPPLVMIAVGKQKYTHEFIEDSKVFAINILSENQKDLARLFGLKTGREINKFENIEFETEVTGSPILRECFAYLDCKVQNSFEVGDHTIYIGDIVKSDIRKEENPLIYNSKDYW